MSSVWSDDKGLKDLIKLSKNPDDVVVLVGMNEAQVKDFSIKLRLYGIRKDTQASA